MFGLVFLAILGYMMYIEIVTFFENRRDEKRINESRLTKPISRVHLGHHPKGKENDSRRSN